MYMYTIINYMCISYYSILICTIVFLGVSAPPPGRSPGAKRLPKPSVEDRDGDGLGPAAGCYHHHQTPQTQRNRRVHQV